MYIKVDLRESTTNANGADTATTRTAAASTNTATNNNGARGKMSARDDFAYF